MRAEIMASESFKRAWEQLTPQMRNIVTGKIGLLAVNRGHPSLRVHRVRRTKADIRICYITNTMRVLFGVQGSILCLYDLGSHSVVDKVHRHSFSRPTCFLQLFEKSLGEYL
jgi:mRNA-degrading endonuclease YafQ of YafQ-DinJ toxin-antitoxin module